MERQLGLIALITLGVDFIIGLGIYTLPGHVFSALGQQSFWVIPICGVLLSIIALNIAELAKRVDRNGGTYAYLHAAKWSEVSFLIGWTNWIGASVGLGIFTTLFANILSQALAISQIYSRFIAIGVLLSLAIFNAVGVRVGSRFMVAFTILKILPLIVLIVAGFIASDLNLISIRPPDFSVVEGWSTAILLTLFVCQGFEYIPVVAGEVKAAVKAVPKATIISLWIAIVIYTLLFVGMRSEMIAGTSNPLEVHATNLLGNVGGAVVGGFALFSILGLLAGRLLAVPRLLAPLCEDGYLPTRLSVYDRKTGTPLNAIMLSVGVAFPFVFIDDFNDFIGLASLGVALNYLFISILNFRILSFNDTRSLVLPTVGVLISLFFLAQVPPVSWVYFLLLVLSGYVCRVGTELYTKAKTRDGEHKFHKP